MVEKLESRNVDFWRLREEGYSERDLGDLLSVPMAAKEVLRAVRMVPYLEVETGVFPISGELVKVTLRLSGDWQWNERYSGASEVFHIFVVDPVNEDLLHIDKIVFAKKTFRDEEVLSFLIPIHPEEIPPQYLVQVVSD